MILVDHLLNQEDQPEEQAAKREIRIFAACSSWERSIPPFFWWTDHSKWLPHQENGGQTTGVMGGFPICSKAEVDRTRPANQSLLINEKGGPSLKKLRARPQSAGLAQLKEALHDKIPERHLLEVVVRITRLTGFGRHLSPLSGNEPKQDDA